ncbi:hypothetical protein M5K25_027726 [Dendrobium thyrsiflorum]|uniref:Uncharacterized protein n=1 Tax=Dendrobium thyrsiflorum TaxID=117978 RepID=A0ABD0TUJ1_DENTH
MHHLALKVDGGGNDDELNQDPMVLSSRQSDKLPGCKQGFATSLMRPVRSQNIVSHAPFDEVDLHCIGAVRQWVREIIR